MKIDLSLARRVIPILISGLVCGALGWSLRGLTADHGNANTTALAFAQSSPAPATGAGTKAASRAQAAAVMRGLDESAAAVGKRVNLVVERMFHADFADAVEAMEAMGMLTRLTDAEVKIAWEELLRKNPRNNAGTSFASLYLWSRMMRMGQDVPVPVAWGAQDFQVAIEAEYARRDRTNVLSRLQSGESVSPTERRVIFTEMLREDPLKAIQLWCRVTKPEEYQGEAQWLGDALTNPETRAGILAQLRTWQAGGDLGGAVAALARNWIHNDPAAVERWLHQPEQADIRDAVMNEVITARAISNPRDAWDWSKSLSDQERRQALETSAPRLAIDHPEIGMELINGLQNAEDRGAAVRGFAFGLAAEHYDQWLQWRDTLAPAERDLANEAGFPYWVNQDVTKAVEWLNSRPAGESRDNMVTSLVFYYADKDPATAVEWIRTIPDAQRRKDAVVATLCNVGPEDLDRVRLILTALK